MVVSVVGGMHRLGCRPDMHAQPDDLSHGKRMTERRLNHNIILGASEGTWSSLSSYRSRPVVVFMYIAFIGCGEVL